MGILDRILSAFMSDEDRIEAMIRARVPPRTLGNDDDPQTIAIRGIAERSAVVIRESLELVRDSRNAATKVSRLKVAKSAHESLWNLNRGYSFLKLDTYLESAWAAIQRMDQMLQESGYYEMVEGNNRGIAFEAEGKLPEAIAEYEHLVAHETDTPHTYKRLAILYAKLKRADDEIRVLNQALANIPESNAANYRWMRNRLAKRLRASGVIQAGLPPSSVVPLPPGSPK